MCCIVNWSRKHQKSSWAERALNGNPASTLQGSRGLLSFANWSRKHQRSDWAERAKMGFLLAPFKGCRGPEPNNWPTELGWQKLAPGALRNLLPQNGKWILETSLCRHTAVFHALAKISRVTWKWTGNKVRVDSLEKKRGQMSWPSLVNALSFFQKWHSRKVNFPDLD